MAKINLNNYETVDERIQRFWELHPNGRITTRLIDKEGEPGRTRWIVEAQIFRDFDDPQPVTTGMAFEVDGQGMTQLAAALETCETSAIGRALANLGLTGNKQRASQHEMRKALIGDLLAGIKYAPTVEELEKIKNYARGQGVWPSIQASYNARRDTLRTPPTEEETSTHG